MSSARPTVLLTCAVPEAISAPLTAHAEVILGPDDGSLMPRADVLRWAPRLFAIINQGELLIDEELLAAAPALRIVANVAIGYNNFDLKAMSRHRVWGTNTPEAFVDSTADYTIGVLLCLARRLVEADRFVRAGRWREFQAGPWDGILLRDKVLGIIGYGRTGRAVARRAEAFGMRILFHRRTPEDDPRYRTLDGVLGESDFVSLHVPLTDETHHLINEAALARMKPSAFLINMARGPVVDEQALIAALQAGRLAGAGLDVFEHEPHVPEELRAMDNVVLLPHTGGGTHESRHAARKLCVDNVLAVLAGGRPLTPVNDLD